MAAQVAVERFQSTTKPSVPGALVHFNFCYRETSEEEEEEARCLERSGQERPHDSVCSLSIYLCRLPLQITASQLPNFIPFDF